MEKRKAISKKLRFEVFKRDGFKCQYCGMSAPDVVLHVDHIHPVSKGGINDALNLITSCESCNSGKSDRLLCDHAEIHKQKAQLEELNKRREQMEMMLKWREGLLSIEEKKVDAFSDQHSRLVPGWQLNETGRASVMKMLRKHDLQDVLDALSVAADRVVISDGKATEETAQMVIVDCKKILTFKARPEHEQRIRYIRGIVRNRMYCAENTCLELLQEAFRVTGDLDYLTQIAKDAKNWTDWKELMQCVIAEGSEAKK